MKVMTMNNNIRKYMAKNFGGNWVGGNICQLNDGVFILEEEYNGDIQEPEYHYNGMGCGLEDKNITDRYDAMEHGWGCAIERQRELLPTFIPVDPITVSQYVGLQDSKKENIYENDILMVKLPLGGFWGDVCRTEIGTVRYESDHGGYIVEWKYSKNQHHVLLTCDIAIESRKIGNKFDHPELLEKNF